MGVVRAAPVADGIRMIKNRLARAIGRTLLCRAGLLAPVRHLLLGVEASAQSDTLWRKSVSGSAKYMSLDEKGHLLVVNEDGITALDPDSGSRVWRYPVRWPIRSSATSRPVTRHSGAERNLAHSTSRRGSRSGAEPTFRPQQGLG
jgi:hypothetical protein